MQAVLRDVTAIVDGAVLAGTVSLRIEGTKVTAISSDPLAPREGEAVIEGKGKLAIPGLINAHTHLPMVLFRGLADELRFEEWWRERIRPIEETLRPEDVYWGSLLGLAEMIRSGTTALADMYFHTDAIGEAVEEAGVRAVLSYGVVASDLDSRGEEELRRAEAVLARWNGKGEGRIRGAVSPHAVFTCGEAVWREAIELAREHDVLLHTHLAETRDEVEWCRKERGATPAKYLDRIGAFTVPTLAAHCVHLDEEEIRLLADRDVTAVHCPKSNAKLGAGIAPVESMRRAGVRVALGTDGAAANNRLDMVEEMRMAALLQKGAREDASALPAREALWMATRAGGEGLRIGGGTLTVGSEADLVLIDLEQVHTLPVYDPLSALVYAALASDVTDVMVGGRFLLRDGELLTIDEERVKKEVKRLSKRYRN
jgi:5-methylthioadenosine/S-adenosylhomocysteine deaminase